MASLDELLSAYIDGQLSAQEQLRVEALVARDAAAKQRLSELRYAAYVLAETPRVPPPRAFTLSQAQVASTRRRWNPPQWLQPAFLRSAAALVAVCLLVLLAGDIGLRAPLAPDNGAVAVQPAQGGLPVDEGDPSDIIAKRPTTAVSAQTDTPATSDFLGLAPGQLLALEITLAVVVVLLMATAWQVGRSVP